MASSAKTKSNLQLNIEQHQLIYSIILEVGLPSTPAAWARVISRLPLRADGRPLIAQGVSMRYSTLKRKWDQAKIFGDNHDEFVKVADKPAGGKAAPRAIKKAQGRGKERDRAEELSGESEDEEGVGSECGSDHEDDKFAPGPSNSKRPIEEEESDQPPVKKPKVPDGQKTEGKQLEGKKPEGKKPDGKKPDGKKPKEKRPKGKNQEPKKVTFDLPDPVEELVDEPVDEPEKGPEKEPESEPGPEPDEESCTPSCEEEDEF